MVDGKFERSCIDFIFACQRLSNTLGKASIDSAGLYQLTKYTSTKGNPSVVKSDHFTIISKFEIQMKDKKPRRQEHFKLRDEDGLKKFTMCTSVATKLRSCFMKDLSLEDACGKWYKEMNKVLHKCFKKIRITNIPPRRSIDYDIYKSLFDIKQLKELHASSHEMQRINLKIELQMEEQKLAILQGQKCKKMIEEDMGHLLKDGAFSLNDAWKLKRKLFPLCTDAPFAVYKTHNILVTDYDGVLGVMLE